MDLKRGVQRSSLLDVESTLRHAKQAGFMTFTLPAGGIVDKASFFDAVCATLPLDPPLVRFHDSWDALSDSLGGGLLEFPAKRIAILWPNARAMASAAPLEFEIALDVLGSVAELLADVRATRDHPKEVAVIVE